MVCDTNVLQIQIIKLVEQIQIQTMVHLLIPSPKVFFSAPVDNTAVDNVDVCTKSNGNPCNSCGDSSKVSVPKWSTN